MKKENKTFAFAGALMAAFLMGPLASHGAVLLSDHLDGYAVGTASTDATGADILGDGWHTSNESLNGSAPTLEYQSMGGDGYLKIGNYNTVYSRKLLAAPVPSAATNVTLRLSYYFSDASTTAADQLRFGLDTGNTDNGGATFLFYNDPDNGYKLRIGAFISNVPLYRTNNAKVDFIFNLQQAAASSDVLATLYYRVSGGVYAPATFDDGFGNFTNTTVNLGSANNIRNILTVFSRTQYSGGFTDVEVTTGPFSASESAAIIGMEPASGGLVKLVVAASNPAASHPQGTIELGGIGWTRVPHSDDGVHPFVVTNLDYSTVSGTNREIYVESSKENGYFSVATELVVTTDRVMAAFNANGGGIHPRIFADAQRFEAIKSRMVTDPEFAAAVNAYRVKGDALLLKPVLQWSGDFLTGTKIVGDGSGSLLNSFVRPFKDRMEIWAFLYRITGEMKYANRAWEHIESLGNMPSWLTTSLVPGELCYGFGLAYDWFYDAFTPTQRAAMRANLLRNGLTPALLVYRGGSPSILGEGPFLDPTSNFAAVVNGGIAIAALAVMAEESIAAEVLAGAMVTLSDFMDVNYEPEGVGTAGPMYFNYANNYGIRFLAALDDVLGTQFGITAGYGFSQTGDYCLYNTGPTGIPFVYSDSGTNPFTSYVLYWLAARYKTPAYGWQGMRSNVLETEANGSVASFLNFLWEEPAAYGAPTSADYPLARLFRGTIELAMMRSAWDDPNALYFAMRGGNDRFDHGHCDIGGFALDADGVRWAVDLGIGNYDWPGYFNGLTGDEGTRWTYYPCRAEGHNTIVINPSLLADQKMGVAPFTAFGQDAGSAFAVLDMTGVYGPWATSARRGAKREGNALLLQDEIALKSSSKVYWSMHTKAAITLQNGGKKAVLTQDGKTLYVKLLAPTNAVFSVMDPLPLPGSPTPSEYTGKSGVKKIVIALPQVSAASISVSFSTEGAATFTPTPLSSWE